MTKELSPFTRAEDGRILLDIHWKPEEEKMTIEKMRERLTQALEETKKALEDIHAKYEDGGFYSNDDSSYQDYYEGQICAYEHAIAVLEGEQG